MKRLHPDFIQEVTERTQIADVVSAQIDLKKRGKEYLGLCPFHNEKTPSFSVSPTKGLAYCFGCSWGGNAVKFLMELGKVSFTDAVKELARQSGVPIRYEDGSSEHFPDPMPRTAVPKPATKLEEPAKDYTVDEGRVQESVFRLLHHKGDAEKARAWLESRGITREIVERYRLGLEKRVVVPDESTPERKETYWAIAVFIPVPGRPGRFYVKKRVAPWLTGGERPSYVGKWAQFGVPATIWLAHNPPDADKTWFCEGEWDAILLGELARRRGEKVAIACSTSGASTVPKAQEVDRLPGQVTIFYDRDEAGQKGARKLATAIGKRGWIASVPTPEGCQVNGWDVSNAIQAGYDWEDFEAASLAPSHTPEQSTDTDRPIDRDRWLWEFGFGKRIRSRITKLLQSSGKHLKAWGFSKTTEHPSDQTGQKSTLQPTEYKPGHRLDTWKNAALSHKSIWDSSGTGTGKSFDAGRLTPELLGCDRVFYMTADPRNPTTETLADWALLDGRHQGLVLDALGKLRRAKRGESYTIQPNCYRVDTIGALREAGIQGSDSSSVICPTCPHVESCRGGHLFGYLNERMNALKSERVRSHPSSLPIATGEKAFDYSKAALVWEEWATIFKNSRQITVTVTDLDKLIVELATKAPEEFSKLQPLLTALRRLIAGEVKQPNLFGWNHHKLIEQLPPLPNDLDEEALASVLEPDLEILDPTSEYGVPAAELPAGSRKKFTESDETTANKVRQQVLKQWLMPFLRVLKAEKGYLTLSYGELTVTTPDDRLVKIAHAAHCNIFLDATGHLDELALLLGIPPEEIHHVRQQQASGAEVRRVQIAGMGRLGQRRGKDQQRRASAVVDELLHRHPGVGVIRFKRQAKEGDYRWFVESRGVNDAQSLDTLILDGIPCENLESLAAQFTCIYGRPPAEGMQTIQTPVQLTNPLPEGVEPYFESNISADSDFAGFVRRRILANIHQAEGRLRATRRQGEQLTVYILGDFALDVPVELVRATDITLEAASKTERVELAIRRAVEQLKATGQEVTQQAIANLTGYTRGHISRFQKLIILLLEVTVSKMITSPPPPESPPDEVQWLSEEYLPLIADNPLSELLSLVGAYGKIGFSQIWSGATAEVQIRILSRLFMNLPVGEVSHLAQCLNSFLVW
jgi:hypothetical protein